MMNNILIDSDILIWFLRKKEPYYSLFTKTTNDYIIYSSVLTLTEILAGAYKRENKIIEEAFSQIEIIEVDKQIAELAGQFLNRYSKSHHIHISDAIIAAYQRFLK